MLNLVLNHSPAFVIGEFLLALSIGMFAIAFANTVRERYAIQVPVAKTQSPSGRFAINRAASAPRPKKKGAPLGLCRSRLSRGQHVSNAACGAEQDERDDEAPCDLKGAASTR
jgi:hypothetical protein